MSYRIYSPTVEIDFKSNEALEKVIMEAWNYEAQVFEYEEYRYLRNIQSKIVYVYSWRHNPFEGNSDFKYQILDGIKKGDNYENRKYGKNAKFWI